MGDAKDEREKIFLSVMKTYLVLVMILLIVLIGCSFIPIRVLRAIRKCAGCIIKSGTA